jgi:hypothetical protein
MRAEEQLFDFPPEDDAVLGGVSNLPALKEEEIERQVPALVDQAAAIVVRDQDTLTSANDFSIAVKRLRREIEETFDPIIESAHRAHKVALGKKKKHLDPVDAAERMVKGKIGAYLTEQERIRKEAERRAWEAEQEKIRAQQEALRKEQEAQRKAEEQRRAIEEKARREAQEADAKAARARSEEGRRRAQEEADRIRRETAERLAADKAKAEAEQARIREEAARKQAELEAAVPAPVARVETKGISTREDWDFEILDVNVIPREFLTIDESKLRRYAKAMKVDAIVPGVRFFSKTIVQQRIA